jgi:hypothetical protein
MYWSFVALPCQEFSKEEFAYCTAWTGICQDNCSVKDRRGGGIAVGACIVWSMGL